MTDIINQLLTVLNQLKIKKMNFGHFKLFNIFNCPTMSRSTVLFTANALASGRVKFPPQLLKKKWGSGITKEIVTFSQFWPTREAKVEFRTFQIIQHFAEKNENMTKYVSNGFVSIISVEMSTNST